MSGWVGVDLDGTLARYDGWQGIDHVGEPIKPMVDRVKRWIAEGKTVKIFTARVSDGNPNTVRVIQEWCKTHIGQVLNITNIKDYAMDELYDDRAVQVIMNTGILVGKSTRE